MRRLRCDKALTTKDLHGYIVVITGATSGIGKQTALQLLRQGATVVLAVRDTRKAHAMLSQHAKEAACGIAEVMQCDVSSLDSVRAFASGISGKFKALHALMNNAGCMNCPYQKTKDGFEMQLGTNYLCPFLLTSLLLPLLEASGEGRVVNVSSANHDVFAGKRGHVELDDLFFERRKYNGWAGYAQSKLCQILHVRELARRHPSVVCVALHPGSVCSNVTRHMMPFAVRKMILPLERVLVGQVSDWVGIQTGLFCLLADRAKLETGGYYAQHQSPWGVKGGWPMRSPNPEATDDALSRSLYEKSMKLVGLEAGP
jgi:NAD(P)-dependent dehydrogenase (short-subunit alcohol dehydrogenase family)